MMMSRAVSVLAMVALVGACSMKDRVSSSDVSASSVAPPGLSDGQLAVPDGYRSWPVYLADIDKVDAGQIRDIYISPEGHQTSQGDDFPDGTISVMEIWAPKKAANGELETDTNGKLIKDELSLIFVMGKSQGAGELVDPAMQTGDWVYAGYQADGATPGGPAAAACRGCHLTQAETDWVYHYDEYFATRSE